MLGAVHGVGCPMLLALTVVGRVALTPAEPLDARIGAAFNAHQRRETRLLGPDAVAAAVERSAGRAPRSSSGRAPGASMRLTPT